MLENLSPKVALDVQVTAVSGHVNRPVILRTTDWKYHRIIMNHKVLKQW